MQAPPTTSSAPSLGGLTDDSLNRIQGNILAGFNLPSQAFLHLSFGNSSENARQWLAEVVRENVIASTRQVLDRSEKAWVAVSFTSSGLLVLDPGLAGDLMSYRAFWDGAIADRVDEEGVRTVSPALVGDQEAGDPRNWAIGGPNEALIDVLMTIAASYDDLLEERAERERTRAREHELTVLMVRPPTGDPTPGQYGYRLRGGVEHFGFKDGISQPSIRDFPAQAVEDQADTSIAAGEFVLGYQTEESPVVQDSPAPPPNWMCDGSFQVWLRLNQDVALWRRQMRVLRESSKDGLDVAAKVIGRQQDGTPLAYEGTSENVQDLNGFNYIDDPSGLKTPLFAHIRKMYPRDPESGDRCHRLLRRGIPFGPPLSPRDSNDATERGLVFNAFMASIERQFEVIQRDWASCAKSISTGNAEGPDPVVGASDAACLLRRDEFVNVALNFEPFVWTTAAVYAFAPSIPTLARLAGQDLNESEV